MTIHAYFDEWSRKPGERVRMAISTTAPRVRATFERLTAGPGGPGKCHVGAENMPAVLEVTIPGRVQKNPVGSYATLPIPPLDLSTGITAHCWIWPTTPDRPSAQTVWSLNGIGQSLQLVLSNHRLELRSLESRLVIADVPIVARRWYSVIVGCDASQSFLEVRETSRFSVAGKRTNQGPGIRPFHADQFLLAAREIDSPGSPVCPYNGKVDSPRLYRTALDEGGREHLHRSGTYDGLLIAGWDFSQGMDSESIPSTVPGCGDGTIHNGAERGVTGHNWDGSAQSFLVSPDQYAALQFHDDDMVDCNWEYDIDFQLPGDLPSGIYAVRLDGASESEHYPLFVGARRGDSAPVLFLAPTNTYLAYANDHLAAHDFSACMGHEKVVSPYEQRLFEDAGLGRSVYDTHSDGTPVRYASRRRPLLNVRPNAVSWLTGSYRHFPVDLYLIEWLERLGVSYHVATDEDLERDGMALLQTHKVVITGSHPEYWSMAGRFSLADYLSTGGRLMYLGGNGFYWVTSRSAERPWVIEVRRDNTGTRCWDAPYGERTHVTTGELGAIWRLRGASPNELVGVGFAAEGWSKAGGYKRATASYTGAGKAFFAGIDAEILGADGLVLGGAAGDEVDRFDMALGSPAHAEVLASASGLGREYQLVIEDQTLTLPNQDGVSRPERVRADMVYFTIPGGGAVFSAGSITYAGALAWNDFDNDLCRLTTNVLRSFIR